MKSLKNELRTIFSAKRRLARGMMRLHYNYFYRIIDNADIDLILDVGANRGQTYERLRKNGYRGKVVSFEPIPEAHEFLRERAKADPAWIVAPRCAIGDRQGEVVLNVSAISVMSSILPLTADMLKAQPWYHTVSRVPTPTVRLDDIYDEYCKPDDKVFLKIDTQGYERHVLNGAAATLNKVHGVQIELSLLPLYEGEETYLTFLNEFHAAGFEPHLIIENGFEKRWSRQRQIDAVFMRPT